MDGTSARPKRWWRWSACGAGSALAALLLCLPACTWDGNFTLFGYSTKPMYNPAYKTVRVPIFTNKTFYVVTPIPGMEMNLTQEVVRAIQSRTPYRIVGCNEPADTEIQGSIISFNKAILNYNQLYETRQTEITLVCRVNWIDLRTGKAITRPGRKAFDPALPDPLSPVGVTSANQVFNRTPIAATPTPATDEVLNVPQPANNLGTPGTLGTIAAAPFPSAPGGVATDGILLRAIADYAVELGQSTATAEDEAYKNMGVKITEMMEMPW